MQMYPAYRLRDVFELYAITFFALLNEGYRLQGDHYLMLSQISDLPHIRQEDRANFYRYLEWATKRPDDILKPDGQGSSPADIKRLLQG